MTAHLNLPYNWIGCVNPETCEEHIHLEDTAETLNNYPTEWTETLLNCTITIQRNIANEILTETIEFHDTNGELHNINNHPAFIVHHHHHSKTPNISRKIWYQHGHRHRENEPAVVWEDGTLEWWRHGLFQRSIEE